MRILLIILTIMIGGPVYIRLQAQYVPPDKRDNSKEPEYHPRPLANQGDEPIEVVEPVRKRGSRRGVAPSASSAPIFHEALNQNVNDVIKLFNFIGGPRRVLRIIQFSDNKSLFVFDSEKIGRGYQYTSLKVDEPLTSEGLRKQLSKHPGKTFIGVHSLDEKSYIMVFYGR